MTAPDRRQRLGGAVAERWNAFWFTPEPAHTLGLVRMAFGVVVLAWALTLLPDLYQLFGAQGVVPKHPHFEYEWSIFEIFSGDRALLIGWVVLVVSALALAVGWHSRLAAIVVFVAVQSFVRRDPFVFNAGDAIVVLIALILALSSCGAALSLDQRRREGSFWSAQTRSPWAVRLLQVQLSLIYLVSVQAKLNGESWLEGSAVSYAWRTDGQWAFLSAPEWLSANAILVNVLTWGTLCAELAIAVLVWNRRLRFWVLGAGVLMHLAMMINLNIGFFSLAMFVLYLAFVPPDVVERMPAQVKSRLSRNKEPADP
jgi:Vitamin K-dependent gamma-carboxylase